jgi:hypothetical protein
MLIDRIRGGEAMSKKRYGPEEIIGREKVIRPAGKNWHPGGDSNPHGFPCHPLKMRRNGLHSSITETESMEKFRPKFFRLKGRKSRHQFIKLRWSKHHPISL